MVFKFFKTKKDKREKTPRVLPLTEEVGRETFRTRMSVAKTHMKKGDYDLALGIVTRALTQKPNNKKALRLRIKILRKMGRTEEAEICEERLKTM